MQSATLTNQHALAGRPSLAAPRRPVLAKRRQRVEICNAVKEIFMPALSSTMTEGKIVSWLKTEGDKIAKGESVVVVESDKADMDVESFQDGILGAIVIQEGGVANVGEPIAYVAESDADLQEAKSKAGGSSAGNGAAPAAKEVPKQETAKVEAPVAAKSEAATTTAPPPPPPQPAATAPAQAPPAPQKRADGRIIATPYAKKLAKELGVDLNSLSGSGPAGRITASDVESFKKGGNGAVSAPAAPAAAPQPAPSAAPSEQAAAPSPSPAPAATSVSELKGTTQPFNALQAAVAKNMVQSLAVPEFRVAYSIKTDALDALYRKLKPKGVTMSGLLVKAAAAALAKHPDLYAACTPDAKGITYNEHINVAVAVTMPDGGLITPVIKDADKTDIYQISRSWADLVKRARAKKLAPDEFNSGTFTISNLGMYGADSFDAILPPGTAAILAVGGSQPTVTVDDKGRMGVEKVMKCNLTCDHRIVYGAGAAEFMVELKAVIENPEQLTF